MNHIISTRLALAGCAALGVAAASASAAEKPVNFIVIHLDDMGYGDLSVTGATGYTTPNLDRLCAEGMRFTNFYSSQPISSASRAGIMTGCYPNRIGFAGALGPGSNVGIATDEETIPEVLKKRGYACSAIGKWHLGDKKPFMPLQQGFDEFYGLPYSHDMWPLHPQTSSYPKLPLYEGNEVINPDLGPSDLEQLTTDYTQRAVEFIERNNRKPFFIYLAQSMPHVPLYVSDKFKGKSEQGAYGDVMMELDWSVGQIIEALEKHKLDKNTVVIFTSDNGPWINYGNHAGSTGGLREGKATSYEGGQRVPCIVWWPGKVPAGTVNNNLACAIDILPTLADFAGAELPKNKIDGVSLREMFLGDIEAQPRESILYYYRRNSLQAVRNDKFKLVFEHEGRTYGDFMPGADGKPGKLNERGQHETALYDMRRDPGERYNVMDMYPEEVAKLTAIANAAREDLGDELTGAPGKNRRPIGRVER